jgi:hypothetical protein
MGLMRRNEIYKTQTVDPLQKLSEVLGLSDEVPTGDCTFYCAIFDQDWNVLAHGRLQGLGWTMKYGKPTFNSKMSVEVIRSGTAMWAGTYAVGSNGVAVPVAISSDMTPLDVTLGNTMSWTNDLSFNSPMR